MLRFLKFIVSGAVAVGGLVAGLVSSEHVGSSHDVVTVSSECLVSGTPLTGTAIAVGNSIVITARMMTPTPCHTAVGAVNVSGNTITGTFSAQPIPAVGCVQCVGMTIGEVTVPGLGPGDYSVNIDLPDGRFKTAVRVL